ncbi:protein Brevis radix-like 2 [Gossypium australe]|uniref:Protein Brevis radix-like 2 n=1 Tax=Gossypium australe TaxID=47621 RepID=A0A5B6X7J0_9ROSI|nr:protein Brevis radix-like 2 [Gossypium australe]
MLTCIACSKQLHNNNGSIGRHQDEDTLETPRTRQTIKALTSQIKDIALKASGAYKSCKPCSGSSNHDRKNYADSDAASDSARFHCPYRRRGSSNSTPGSWGKEKESRLKELSSGEGTPVSVSGRTGSALFMEEDEPKEWVAQVEPGVLITFVSLPEGGNDLKRIRFRYFIYVFGTHDSEGSRLFEYDHLIFILGIEIEAIIAFLDSFLALGFGIEGFNLLDCHCMCCLFFAWTAHLLFCFLLNISREMFNKWQAQRWWAENYDKVMELYNVQRFNRQVVPLPTPPGSEDKGSITESAKDSPVTPPLNKERPHNFIRPTGMGYSSSDSLDHHPMQSHQCYDSAALVSTPKLSSINGAKTETSSIDGSVRTSSSREADQSGELSISNASDMETEWVEQDEPGVYITIRALPGGTRELRRVRFSREKFGEMHARVWWEENRARIQEQYL